MGMMQIVFFHFLEKGGTNEQEAYCAGLSQVNHHYSATLLMSHSTNATAWINRLLLKNSSHSYSKLPAYPQLA